MAFAGTGAFLSSTTAALTVANQAVGDLLAVSVINTANSTVWCTGLSGGGATWIPAGVHYSGTVQAWAASVFTGRVTATGAGTVTPTWSGTAPASYAILGHEFTSTAGSWAFRVQGNLNGADTAWPTLTPSSDGQLYWGYASDVGSAVAGTTAGYTYNIDANGDGAAFNPACAAGVGTFPSFTDVNNAVGISVLIAEVWSYTPQLTPPGRRSPASWAKLAVPQVSTGAPTVTITPATVAVTTTAAVPSLPATVAPATVAVTTATPVPSFGWSLFGGQVPSSGTLFSDPDSSDIGIQFTVTGAGNLLSGYSFYLTPGAPNAASSYQFSLYSTTNGTTGTLLAGPTAASGFWVSGRWQFFQLVTPVALTSGTTYVAVVTQAAQLSCYYCTQFYFASGPGTAGIASGPLAAPSAAAALGGVQGTQNEPSTGLIPAGTISDGNFWLDVLVTQPVSATITPVRAVATANALVPLFIGPGDAVATPATLAVTTSAPAPVLTVPVLPAIVAVTTAAPVPTAGTQALPVGNPSGGPWVIALAEEFTDPKGIGKPDPLTWSTHLVTGDMYRSNSGSIGPNAEVEWYPHNLQNTAVTGGNLVLTASAADPHTIDPLAPAGTATPSGATLAITSGMISSNQGFNFTYGYAEARIKLPPRSTVGIWPAFYLVGADGNWPPESDIMEDKGYAAAASTWWPDTGGTGYLPYPSDDGNFHVYGMRWTPSDVTYFYDGTQWATYSTPTSYPMFVYLEFAVVQNYGPQYPASVYADYIRVWQISGAPAQPAVTSLSPANGIPTAGTLQVNFSTVGAPSYRATSAVTDYYADVDSTYATFALPRASNTGTTSPITISGLTNGVRYHATVAAQNAGGLYSLESLPYPQIPLIQTVFLPVASITTAFPQPVVTGSGVTAIVTPLAVTTAAPIPAVTGSAGSTFTAVGTFIQSQAATMTVTPTAIRNFFLAEVQLSSVSNLARVTGVSGGNCTWAQLGTTLVAANSAYVSYVFLGTVTGTGAATATIATSGTVVSYSTVAQEFSSTSPSWGLDGAQGNLDLSSGGAGTVTYPSLTPSAPGSLYFCYCGWVGTAAAGTTTGYTWDVDAVGDGLAFNPACTTSAQSPVWAANATAAFSGIAILLKGTGAIVTPLAVAVTGSIATPTISVSGDTLVSPAVKAVTTTAPIPTVVVPVSATAAPAVLAVTTAQQIVTVGVAPVPVGNPSGGPWVLTFTDEFTDPKGIGKPDPALWASHLINGVEIRQSTGAEIEWSPHNLQNMSVSGGQLTITASYVGAWPAMLVVDPECPNPSPAVADADTTYQPQFVSGFLSSHPVFQQSYGYFEARLQLPAASGSWAAWWMNDSDGLWPPEFDIAEAAFANAPTYNYIPPSGSSVTGNYTGGTYTSAMHVFGLRWTPSNVTFFVDGTQAATTSTSIASNPAHLILNLAVASSQAGSGSGFPSSMLVDYVRAWSTTGVPAIPAITSISPASGVPSAGSLTVNFSTVSGATSYRVSVPPMDALSAFGASNTFPGLTANTGTTSPITVTGLTNGIPYTATVAAKNAGGYYSPESPPVPAWPTYQTIFQPALGFTAAFPAVTVTTSSGVAVTPATVAVTTAQSAVTVTVPALPAVLAAGAGFPALAVSPGPATLAVAAAFPAAVVQVRPATLAISTATPVPAVSPGPATLAVSTAVPAPAIIPGPATLAVSTAQPLPAISPGPAALSVSTSFPSVTVITPAGPATLSTSISFPQAAVSPGPATLAVATAFPDAAVSPAPATLAVATAQPVPAITVPALPAALAVTAAFPAAVVATSGNANIVLGAPLAVAAAQPAVTVSIPVLAAVLTAATTQPVPAVSAQQNASAAPAALAVTAAQPAVTVTVPVLAAVLAVAAAFPAPAVAAAGNATAAPAVVTVSTSAPAPVVRQDQAIAVLVLTVLAAQPPPAVSPGPAILAVTTAVPVPAVTTSGGGATATPATLAVTSDAPAPGVSGAVTLAALAATAAVPAPAASGSAGMTLAALSVTVALPGPAVSTAGNANIAAVTITATFAAPIPLVRRDQAVALATLAITITVTAPLVTTVAGITGTLTWVASPAAPRWQVQPAGPRWRGRAAQCRWRVAMTVFEPIAALSLEEINVLWTSELLGTVVDPTGQSPLSMVLVVQFAFPVSSGNPARPAQPVTWYTGSWLLGTTAPGYLAQCLVGPSGGVTTLVAGTSYDVWSGVLGTPETPKKFAGVQAVI